MRAGSFYDKLLELVGVMYSNPRQDFNEWKCLDVYEDKTSLRIGLYDTGKEVIFSICGTNMKQWGDWVADIALANKHIPAQAHHAEIYYNNIKDKYKNIIFTGYSLGGSVAQILGCKYNKETITFGAFGVGDIINGGRNIINFGNEKDFVFMSNIEKQIGDVYMMPIKTLKIEPRNMLRHWNVLYGKPSTAVKVDIKKNKSLYTDYNKVKEVSNYVKQGVLQTADNLKDYSNKAYNKTQELKKKYGI